MHAVSPFGGRRPCTWRRTTDDDYASIKPTAPAPRRASDAWRTRDILVDRRDRRRVRRRVRRLELVWTRRLARSAIATAPGVPDLRGVARAGRARAADRPQAGRRGLRRDGRRRRLGLLGSPWGPDSLLSGFVQGAAAELVFAMTLLPQLVAAGPRRRGGRERGRRVGPRLGPLLRGRRRRRCS